MNNRTKARNAAIAMAAAAYVVKTGRGNVGAAQKFLQGAANRQQALHKLAIAAANTSRVLSATTPVMIAAENSRRAMQELREAAQNAPPGATVDLSGVQAAELEAEAAVEKLAGAARTLQSASE